MTLIKRLLALFQSCPPYRHHCEHKGMVHPYRPDGCQQAMTLTWWAGPTCCLVTCCRCGAHRLEVYSR